MYNKKWKLYHADFFKKYQNIEKHSVNLFLSDLPYNLFGEFKAMTGVNDDKINLGELKKALDYLLRPEGQILLFCDFKLLNKIITRFRKKLAYRWHYILQKNSGMPAGNTRPLNNAEYVVVMKRKAATPTDLTFHPRQTGIVKNPYRKKNNQRHQKTRKIIKSKHSENKDGRRWVTTILPMTRKCNLPTAEKTKMPFQKPEKLLRMFIRIHSNPGDLVVDGFAGSGSTIVSAWKEERHSIGFEIEKKWYDVSSKRVKDVAV